MIKVANKGCIRRLGFRSMRAAKTRNIVAALAIALTTLLFTSLFTIAASINYSFQQENFRQAGGDGHGTFKELTWEQAEQFRQDPLIQDSWARLYIGMPSDPPFNKSHVEISYMEPNGAPHYFCDPVEGTLPREGTGEMATDTHILALLGVEPKIGTKITLPVSIDDSTAHPQTFERTFTLSGWWEYDSAVVVSHILISRSAAEEFAAMSNGDPNTMTGIWSLNMMFQNSINIKENLNTVLEHNGYQCIDSTADNFMKVGVNWGYTGDRLTQNLDPMTVIVIVAVVLLIIFTGYLIIYNVFQISVTNDIRFYGLLKTIGATGKQLKTIIRQQALLLSLLGIPLGLILGFLTGNQLTPIIMEQLSYKNAFVTFNPWIFIGAAAFSLLTVFLSCARPGRMAARVSPVEAVRYTEGGSSRRSWKKSKRAAVRKTDSGASVPKMAWANLGRSKSKTTVTVFSLALAVVLMNLVYTFASGFDMEKYLSRNICTDFILGHADYFQSGAGFHSVDEALPEEIISDITAQGGITEGGRVYGQEQAVQAFMPEEYYRQNYSRLYSGEQLEKLVAGEERIDETTITGSAQLYGMEEFPLSKLELLEGDLSPLSDPSQNAIAAAYYAGDYSEIVWSSNCFKLGDTVTLRYVDEWMYIDLETGEELTGDEVDARWNHGDYLRYASRAKTYKEVEYTVCALVEIPNAIGYRYSTLGGSQLVMGAERLQQDSGMHSVMNYAFNTTEDTNASMEEFLSQYTESVQPIYDYESKQSYMDEFEGFRNMFLTMGGALAGIIGLIGVLNFINAVLTGILTRKRELAVLQSVGMTGKQLKSMLVHEGLYYTCLAVLLSLILSAVLGPLAGGVCGNIFWFFTYRFTILPVLVVLPIFLILGILVPLRTYCSVSKHTIVERLREAEG